MCMADSTTRFAPILTSRQRRHPVELPEDPTEEELARDWALSDEDREEARRCRGEASRLRFAVQLCVVRRYGRFLDDYAGVSARIVNFLSRQLDLPPVLAVQPSRREGTQHEHQRRIREYLGLQTFDLPTQEQIELRAPPVRIARLTLSSRCRGHSTGYRLFQFYKL